MSSYCSISCNEEIYKDDLCKKHYSEMLNAAIPDPDYMIWRDIKEKQCCSADCNEKLYKDDLCKKHYSEMLNAAIPDPEDHGFWRDNENDT
jgi:hypothetical protein